MNKKLSFANRINTILALAVVFLLVLATNRIDQHHFKTAQKSVNEVFKDRVLVQDYIFSMSNVLREKQLALYDSSSVNVSSGSKQNAQIAGIISKFEATKLTPAESNLLWEFKGDFKALDKLENAVEINFNSKEQIKERLLKLQSTLVALSEIQVHESRRLTQEAQKSLDVSNLLAKLEIFFLIVIGVAVQVLIFYKSKKLVRQESA